MFAACKVCCCFDALPPEMILKILKHLSPSEVLNLSGACQKVSLVFENFLVGNYFSAIIFDNNHFLKLKLDKVELIARVVPKIKITQWLALDDHIVVVQDEKRVVVFEKHTLQILKREKPAVTAPPLGKIKKLYKQSATTFWTLGTLSLQFWSIFGKIQNLGPHYHHSLGRLICFENYAAIITDHVKIMYIHDHASVHCILNSKTDSYRMSDWDYYNVVTEDVCFYKATRPVQIAILTRRKKNTSSFTLAWLFATPSKAIYLSEMHLNVCGRNWTQFKLLWTAERR